MGYEYRRLLEEIAVFGEHIHLQFSVGKDQVRGTKSHEEIIQLTCGKVLGRFRSYSFHDLNLPWEMVGAAAVLACSACYSTTVAEANGIPCYIFDDYVKPAHYQNLHIVNTYEQIRNFVKAEIDNHEHITDIMHIIYDIANARFPKR